MPRLSWRVAPAVGVLVIALAFVAARAITTPFSANDSLGDDGLEYARLVYGLRGITGPAPEEPFAFRVFPAGLVAVSGQGPWIGFLALDLAATAGTALLMLVLLRRKVSPADAVLAVICWALMPFAVRFVVEYPVLTDPTGTFLLLAVVAAAEADQLVTFAVVFACAVLTRESLALLAPLMLIAKREGRILTRAAVIVPGATLLTLVHLAPPVTPTADSATTAFYVIVRVYSIFTDRGDELSRLAAAPLFAFGAFVELLVSRSFVAAVRRRPVWTYTIAVMGLAAVVGGADHDRYLASLAPLLVVITVPLLSDRVRTRALLTLVALQLVAGRVLMPLDGSRADEQAFCVGLAPLQVIVTWSLVILACALALGLIRRTAAVPRSALALPR